ncbi:hypothetical protein J22TS3_02200 [Paenibacillus sp. J22TS3]|nr:hypothetical protein J22TS3_02200 [Paenibacillus sp. J22TS3]
MSMDEVIKAEAKEQNNYVSKTSDFLKYKITLGEYHVRLTYQFKNNRLESGTYVYDAENETLRQQFIDSIKSALNKKYGDGGKVEKYGTIFSWNWETSNTVIKLSPKDGITAVVVYRGKLSASSENL